jgi:hypothetical protein
VQIAPSAEHADAIDDAVGVLTPRSLDAERPIDAGRDAR